MGKSACNIQQFDIVAYKEKLYDIVDSVLGDDFNDDTRLYGALKSARETRQSNLDKMHKYKSNPRERSRIIQANKKIDKNIKVLNKHVLEYEDKLKTIDLIKNTIKETVLNYKSNDLMKMDPGPMIEALKDYMEDRFTPFGTLHDLDLSTLRAINTRLNKLYKKQSKLENKRKMSQVSDTMGDPIVEMMNHDKSGLGTKFIATTKDYLYNKYQLANKYIDRLKNAQSNLSHFIHIHKAWMYNVSEGFNERDAIEQSLANTNELVADILDERTRWLKPTPVFILNENGEMVFSKEFEDNKDAIIKAINDDLDHGISEGLHIQKMEPEGINRPIFVVSIKQDANNNDGQEIWLTFEVPSQRIGEKNEYQPERYPLKKDGGDLSMSSKRWKFWKEYFKNTARGMGIANMDPNDTSSTLMSEGFHEAVSHTSRTGTATLKGGRKSTYKTSAYYNYRNLPTLPQEQMPREIWDYVNDLRRILKEFYVEIAQRTSNSVDGVNNKLSELVSKGIISNNDKESLLNDLLGIDLDSNMYVKDKKLVHNNQYMGEKENYFPHKRSSADDFQNLLRIENKIYEALQRSAEELEDFDSDNTADPEDITSKEEEYNDILSQYQYIREMILVKTGQKSAYDIANTMKLIDVLKHAKQRTGVISPLPSKELQNDGRRGDFQVLVDYVNNMVDNAAKGELKLKMLDILAIVPGKVKDYLVDHLKATIGRRDARAAFPFFLKSFEYGEKEVSDFAKKLGLNATPEWIYTVLKIPGAIISGNLLGIQSAQRNSWQQVSVWIESSVSTEVEAHEIEQNTPEIKDEIIKQSGVSDLMASIADSLLGSVSGDIEWNSGFFAAKDLLLFNLPQKQFLQKVMSNKAYEKWLVAMESRLGLDEGSLVNDMQNVMNGMYETAHSLRQGTLSKKDIKALEKNTKLRISRALANTWVKWGLEGGWINHLIRASDTRGAYAFSGTEERMRGLAAITGAILAVKLGKVPDEWIKSGKSPYLHPEAIRSARIMVNKTMFGMTPEFYAKFLRGGAGQTFFKFMPYSYMQIMREGKLILGWLDSMKDLSPAEKSKFIWDTMKLSDDPKGSQELKMHRFFYTRVLASAMQAGSSLIPFVGVLNRLTGVFTKGLYGQSGLGRGLESVSVSLILRTLHVMQAAINTSMYDDEEEDKIYQNWLRMWMPMYLNTTIDLLFGESDSMTERAMKGFGLYSRSLRLLSKEISSWTDNPPSMLGD